MKYFCKLKTKQNQRRWSNQLHWIKNVFSGATILFLFSCGLVEYGFNSQPGVSFQDSRSTDESTGVFNSQAGRLESEDICSGNTDCIELCDSMLRRLSDQEECYGYKESEVQVFRDVYNLLAVGNPRKLVQIDTDEMEDFLAFGPELWQDAIYGFERQRKENCVVNSGDSDPRDRDDCRLSNYYKQEGYWSDGAVAALAWIARNDWLAELITENDEDQLIMRSLLEILARGGGQRLSDESDREPPGRRRDICDLRISEPDLDGDGNCDVSEDLDGDEKLDCGEDLNCDGDCDDARENFDNDATTCIDNEDLNDNGGFDRVEEDRDGDGRLDQEDIDGDGNPDCGEDLNCDGVCDARENFDNDPTICRFSEDVLDADGDGECGDDRNCDGDCTDEGESQDPNADPGATCINWDDLNGDDNRDCGEDLNCDGDCDDAGENFDNDATTCINNEDLDRDGNWQANEDTNGNGVLDYSEDIDGDGNFDNIKEDRDGDGYLDVFSEDRNQDGDCDDNIGNGRLYPSAQDLSLTQSEQAYYEAFGADCVNDNNQDRRNYMLLSVAGNNRHSVNLGHETVNTLCSGQDRCIRYFYCYIQGGRDPREGNSEGTIFYYMQNTAGISGWRSSYSNCNDF